MPYIHHSQNHIEAKHVRVDDGHEGDCPYRDFGECRWGAGELHLVDEKVEQEQLGESYHDRVCFVRQRKKNQL